MNTELLHQYIAEDRLIRGAWVGKDAQGRATACLLATLSPEVAKSRSAYSCPSSIMPAWLAHLTPWIDDCGTKVKCPGFVARYAAVISPLCELPEARLEIVRRRALGVILREARSHVGAEFIETLAAIDGVLTLCDRTDAVGTDEWIAAKATAKIASVRGWGASAWAASAARVASTASTWAVGTAVRGASEATARAAFAAARAAFAAASATELVAAAERASADRMIDGILGVFESATKAGAK